MTTGKEFVKTVVDVNYDRLGGIKGAIEDAKFDGQYVRPSFEVIPLIGTGQIKREVHEVYFGSCKFDNCNLPNVLKGYGFEFVDPLTTISLACLIPDRQRQYPLVSLFTDNNGRDWSICLTEYKGRYLSITLVNPYEGWTEHCRFLCVSVV